MQFEIRNGAKLYNHLYDREKFEVFGQMRGDWYPLGVYRFDKGLPTTVRIVVDSHSGPTRADAILLVRVDK